MDDQGKRRGGDLLVETRGDGEVMCDEKHDGQLSPRDSG